MNRKRVRQYAVVWLSRFAKGPRSAQFITGLMGIVIFIGDYSNAMLVGPTMRPLTDHHRVSREKLAFLVDSTSAPIAGLAFVSTWIGYEVGLFEDISETLGLGRDGYSMFFDALSFRFYCVLAIIFVIVNALSGKDYGPMRTAEARARETGDIAAPDAQALGHAASFTSLPTAVVQPFSAVLPLLALFGLLLGGFWIDGNGTGSIFSLTSWRNALSEANNVMVLAGAAASAFVVAIICARWLSKLRFSEIAPVLMNTYSSLCSNWLITASIKPEFHVSESLSRTIRSVSTLFSFGTDCSTSSIRRTYSDCNR